MIQVRNGMFESNSSSSHVIVTTKNDICLDLDNFNNFREEDIYINKYGVWSLAWDEEDLEFGRYPMKVLCTLSDKAKYAYANYCGYADNPDKEAEKITEILKRIIPRLKSVEFPVKQIPVYEHKDGSIVDENIKVHIDYSSDDPEDYYIKDGKKIVVYESNQLRRLKNYYGFVDHQSAEMLDNFLKKKNISLEEFLRCKRYVIIIDGDEYKIWDEFKYSGLINTENIVEEYHAVAW